MSALWQKNIARDDGFSIAEVVMGAAIMFFVLTATVGLVGTSQKMVVTAKDRSILTNAMAQYADKIRSLEYYQISTLPPSGLVKPTETVTIEGYDVSFYNRVVTPDGETGKYLKSVYISAQCTIKGTQLHTSAVVNIRNPRNDTTAQRITDPNTPAVTFIDPTPPDYSLLFHDTATGQDLAYSRKTDTITPLRLAAGAQSPNDVMVSLKFYVGNNVFYAKEGRLAQETWSPGLQYVSGDWGWNTTDWVRPFLKVYDGLQAVVAQGIDSQTREGLAQRYYIVDNVSPVKCNKPVILAAGQTSTSSSFQTTAAPDPAPHAGSYEPSFASAYRYQVRKEPASLVTTSSLWTVDTSKTIEAGESDMIAMLYNSWVTDTFTTTPFSRYFVAINALSPLGNSRVASLYPGRWESGEVWSKQFISRPELVHEASYDSSCTSQKSASNRIYTVNVFMTKPTFPIGSGSTDASFTLLAKDWSLANPTQLTGPTITTYTTVGPYWKLKFTWTDTGSGKDKPYWFKVRASVNPAGWRDGSSTSVESNAIGPAPTNPDPGNMNNISGSIYPDTTWTK